MIPVEQVSFRPLGEITGTPAGSEYASTGDLEGEHASAAFEGQAEAGTLVLDPELDDSWSLVNQLFSRVAQRNSAAAGFPGLGYSNWEHKSWHSAWNISGELAAGLGTSTFSDRDLVEFLLREEYSSVRGNTYSFTQAYRADRSWVNSGMLILGARQALENVLWNGDLVLDEELRSYKDKDSPAYDRRDALFKLRFTPEWDAGRTRARLEYKYNAHIYDQLSPSSYKLNQARARLERDFSDKLYGEVTGELARYKYSQPGVFSNNRGRAGARLEWDTTSHLKLTAAAKTEERDYTSRQQFSYQRDTAGFSATLRPDIRSKLVLGTETTSNERDAAPGDYRDTRYTTHYMRALNSRLDLSARYEDRRKHYAASPLQNLDQRTARLALDAYPGTAWNLRFDLARRESDFALAARSYTTDESVLGADYYAGAWRLGASAGRRTQNYDIDDKRDFTLDSLRLDAAYTLERSHLSAYYGGGWLSQANPAARNGYVETCLGAVCELELDATTTLRVCYDSSTRDYKNGLSLEDTLLEARLAFDF